MDLDEFALGVLWYVAFLLSTTCHEAAHAFVSYRGGDPTAARGGQLSLNPLPHIQREVFGMLIVPLLTFAASGWMMGWASAPHNPKWAWQHPRRAAAMALAGPVANLLLAILAGIAIRLGLLGGWLAPPQYLRFSQVVTGQEGFAEGTAMILSILFSINLLLCVFNLFPVPPLDGWSALGLILPESGARAMASLHQRYAWFSIIGLLIAWQFAGRIFVPVFRSAVRVLYSFLS